MSEILWGFLEGVVRAVVVLFDVLAVLLGAVCALYLGGYLAHVALELVLAGWAAFP